MKLQWECKNPRLYSSAGRSQVYEIRLCGLFSPLCELRVRPRARLVNAPLVWELRDTYKNPATAMAFAQHEEDGN